jgi:outer membrane protein assembly factor BamD (BamD/ComL family)
MSTSGISSTVFAQLQQFQKDFQLVGKDLQSGNVSAAQSDFVTLQSDLAQFSSPSLASTSQSDSPLAEAFNQLAQDIQSGNLSAAQKDYATIQQDIQSQVSQTHPHHHHHHSGGGEESQAAQLLSQLGQDLQSGDLSSAKSDFTSLQQLLSGSTSAGSVTPSTSASAGLSITA